MKGPAMFDDMTAVYEAMIDWPKRLANEAPFYRGLFDRGKVKKVADVACGTGRHAAMFHSWGIDVIGADLSPNMIRQAKELFGEPAGLRWVVQSFDQRVAAAGSLDAVVCLGNSLALAPDTATATRAVDAMFEAVGSGGLVIVHVLNLWKMESGPLIWQKVVRRTVGDARVLIVKGVHRCGSTGWVELMVAPEGDESSFHARAVPFLGLRREDLEVAARKCGAATVDFHGSPKANSYDDRTSTDLIMVAVKA